jgi:hypothetical protein
VKYESATTHHSKVINKVKVFEKKVKLQGQRSECRGHDIKRKNTHVKYESPVNQKLWPRLKFLKIMSNSMVRGSMSLYQMKGLAIKNTHVKYESPTPTNQKL